MASDAVLNSVADVAERESWLPMIAIALGQALMSFNVTVLRGIADNPMLPPEIQSQIDLDNINFVSNDRLPGIMQRTSATSEQVLEAVRVNTDARLVGDHSSRRVARLQAWRNPPPIRRRGVRNVTVRKRRAQASVLISTGDP